MPRTVTFAARANAAGEWLLVANALQRRAPVLYPSRVTPRLRLTSSAVSPATSTCRQARPPSASTHECTRRSRRLPAPAASLRPYLDQASRFARKWSATHRRPFASTCSSCPASTGSGDSELLDAERTQLQAEEAVAHAEAEVFTGVAAVYKGLGGVVER